jgi:hypothetical protein
VPFHDGIMGPDAELVTTGQLLKLANHSLCYGFRPECSSHPARFWCSNVNVSLHAISGRSLDR